MTNEIIGNVIMVGIVVSVIGSVIGIVLSNNSSFDDNIYTTISGVRHNNSIIFVIQKGHFINDSCCIVKTINDSYTYYFNYWSLGQFKTVTLLENNTYYDVKIIDKTSNRLLFTGRFI